MKRILAVCVLCALLLCSCGSQTQGTVPMFPTQSVSLPQPAAPMPSLEPVIVDSEPTPVPLVPRNDELVRVQDYLTEIRVDLRYAGTDNFTGTVIYDFSDAWLRYGTVRKLQTAQESLREQGYGLLIWDAYRPQTAQFRLWEVVPNSVYVANPYTGHSSHSSGGTVDITLVTTEGEPVEMPSGFDEFSALADRDYRDVTTTAGEHAQILERAMTDAGFAPYSGEWWHYSDMDAYPFEDLESIELPACRDTLYTLDGEESINLLTAPDYNAEVLVQIPQEACFQIQGFAGDFVRVVFRAQQGYVLRDRLQIQNS